DSAKAPNGTLQLAFDALRDVGAPRRRIVLGSIADSKGERKRIYRPAIQAALEVAEEVILVTEGENQERYAPEAAAVGRYRCFPGANEAAEYIARTAIPDEAILLKGSANFHLERILMNLTGKVRCWEVACGRSESCFKCGLVDVEYEQHRAVRRRRKW